jgi:hypothetical protein
MGTGQMIRSQDRQNGIDLMLNKFISRMYVPECGKVLLDYMISQKDALLSGMLSLCRLKTVIREKNKVFETHSVTEYF